MSGKVRRVVQVNFAAANGVSDRRAEVSHTARSSTSPAKYCKATSYVCQPHLSCDNHNAGLRPPSGDTAAPPSLHRTRTAHVREQDRAAEPYGDGGTRFPEGSIFMDCPDIDLTVCNAPVCLELPNQWTNTIPLNLWVHDVLHTYIQRRILNYYNMYPYHLMGPFVLISINYHFIFSFHHI